LPFAADAAGTEPERAKAPPGARAVSPSLRASATWMSLAAVSDEAQALKLHYVAEFRRTRGCDPAISSWSRAMKAFGELAALDGAKAIITRALSDEYTRRVLPWELVQDAPKHQGQAPRKTNGRAPHVQRGVAEGVGIAEFEA
jgi:hypothetical protein